MCAQQAVGDCLAVVGLLCDRGCGQFPSWMGKFVLPGLTGSLAFMALALRSIVLLRVRS